MLASTIMCLSHASCMLEIFSEETHTPIHNIAVNFSAGFESERADFVEVNAGFNLARKHKYCLEIITNLIMCNS